MEGTLLKWTNYYNGWQPRYFILNQKGILSYYKSKETINEGCKGSCLVLACEVKVHSNDQYRFDLFIPGEQFFSLKANSQGERQRWLVALGTCKSIGCQSDPKFSMKIPFQTKERSSQIISRFSQINNELKSKVEELRLNENLVKDQVQLIKLILNNKETPNVKELDEKTLNLNITCDRFIKILNDCVRLATGTPTDSSINLTNEISSRIDQQQSKKNRLENERVYQTFFSEIESRYPILNCLSLETLTLKSFVSICEEYFELLNRFDQQAFKLLYDDVKQSINKFDQTIEDQQDNINKFLSIIIDEQSKEYHCLNSDWTNLLRSFNFLGCFLLELSSGDQTFESAFNNSYRKTLKITHDWNVRQNFSVAFQLIQSKQTIITLFNNNENIISNSLLEQQIFDDIHKHGILIHRLYSEIVEKTSKNFY